LSFVICHLSFVICHLPFVIALKRSALLALTTVAEALGSEAEQLEQAAAAQSRRADLAPALHLARRHGQACSATRGRVGVVELDGVQAPLRDGCWREVKCAVVYELSW
jgi:hypothetical protein